MAGSKIMLSGEYARMQDTFRNLAVGLVLASVLIYFLMVALDRSWIVPLTVMLVVPLCLTGVLPMLYFTGTALNVQSLLGIIFIVGIKVANTVLMTDFAQELRHAEGLDADRGHSQSGGHPRAADHDDGAGGFLRHDSRGPGAGTRQRSQRAVGPGDSGRPAGGRTGNAVRVALPVCADGARFQEA